MELHLERADQQDESPTAYLPSGGIVAITPELGGDYWSYRVVITPTQAVVGFPKFGTIGIGFAVEEEDWNTNLPYTSNAETIRTHIWDNRGKSIRNTEANRTAVLEAIKMIQAAAHEDRGTEPNA